MKTRRDYWRLLNRFGPMTAKQVWVLLGVPRSTIKKALLNMVQAGYLSRGRIPPQPGKPGGPEWLYEAIGSLPPKSESYYREPSDEPLKARVVLTGPLNDAITRWNRGIRR